MKSVINLRVFGPIKSVLQAVSTNSTELLYFSFSFIICEALFFPNKHKIYSKYIKRGDTKEATTRKNQSIQGAYT